MIWVLNYIKYVKYTNDFFKIYILYPFHFILDILAKCDSKMAIFLKKLCSILDFALKNRI